MPARTIDTPLGPVTLIEEDGAITTLGWFLNNRVMSFEDQSPTQVMVFDRWIVPWLKQVERVIKPPFGMSVIAIGRKLGVGQA